MSIPTSEPLPPEEPQNLPPARRRRKKRAIVPGVESKRTEYLEELAHQVIPSFDFFLFSMLSGLILIPAILTDKAPFYILVLIAAPFMAPVAGLSLATIVGAANFFFQALGGISMGGLFVFLAGVVAGWIGKGFAPLALNQATMHVHFSWADLVTLTVGAALTTYLLTRTPKEKPLLASIALAYELYLPIGIAGFGLSSGIDGFWPNGLVIFVVHLIWATLIGTIVLAILGLRPRTTFGYVLAACLALAGLITAVAVVGNEKNVGKLAQYQEPTVTQTVTPSPRPSITPSKSSSPVPPTLTNTIAPSQTPAPSSTPTIVLPTPTPMWALINANEGNGAIIRAEADLESEMVTTVLNGMLVQVFEIETYNSRTWAHIRLKKNGADVDGWILRSLIATATPNP